ncbi:hypothetical protein CMI43_02525, partial [Candidatus Pacearchaeota archaeon]|nr:hypothetical protein [Candidatus Pacearchaeota archaeon]
NITAVVWSEGFHNVTVWANDSSGNENFSSISFTIDSIYPDLNITSPTNLSSSTDTGLDVNFTRSDSNLASCWYSNDSHTVNTTISNCANITSVVWSEGLHNVTVWVNDSFGNENKTSVTFNVTEVTAPLVVTSAAPTAAGGRGGGGGVVATIGGGDVKIRINPTVMSVAGVINEVNDRDLEIINDDTKFKTVSIVILDDGGFLSMDLSTLSFRLDPGQKNTVKLKLIAPEVPGTYSAKIYVNGELVLIKYDVSSKELLFDAGIVVSEDLKLLNRGDNLESQVTLIPMGENPRLDVTTNYAIKNFDGRTFLSEGKTFLIEGEKTFKKNFVTGNLPPGKYIVSLELIYPNGVAVSSSHFEIKGRGFEIKIDSSNYLMVFLVLGIFILIGFIISEIRRYKKVKLHKVSRKR